MTYEETLRHEVVYDLGSEIIDIIQKMRNLHGADPQLGPMVTAAVAGAVRELNEDIPHLKRLVLIELGRVI